jgi:outer membrane receptor protein involved in Fe transport
MKTTTELNPVLRHAVRMALLGAGAFAASTMQSSIAQAQSAPAKVADTSPELQEVVVTGSRIATPNLDSISPVTAVSSEEIKETGTVRIEDLVNSLPQVVADQGSGLSMGSNGTATINLRGLGSQRTLVLVNGRRLQGGDPGASFGSNPAFASAADINQIPVALVERVDVLTGGASSTYGADAVAGVVNFVMNDHFEGVRLDANAGIYNHSNHESWINDLVTAKKFPSVTGTNWDGANRELTLIMGHNFADGAGNFEGYLGYRRTSQATADHRDHAACQLSRNSTSSSPFSCGGSSTSAPTVFENPTAGFAEQINPDGTLGPRYARFNYAASHYLQRNDERYTAGFYGHLKFNDHAEAYTEFSFMDDQTRGNYAPAGSFLGSGKAIDADSGLADGALSYNCWGATTPHTFGNAGMNPYITAGEFPTLCPGGPSYTNATNVNGLAPYQFNAATGIGQILVGRRNVEGGPREDNYEHAAYRGVFGVRGEIVSNWTYDAYGLFARTTSSDFHNNDTSTERMQNALLAVPGPNGPVCSGGQAGCVPWNIFNPAIPVSPAALAYFSLPGLFNASTDEEIASAFVSGDLTQNGIKTPWADSGLKVVLGTEYRRDVLVVQPDAEFQSGDLAGNGSPTPPVNAGQHVWEGFTEARMALAHDMPFAKTLDVEGGYRYSNYTEGYSTSTFKFGLEWAPVSDVRLRASYNRAVRAPNLQELFQPQHVALDSGGDACVGGVNSGLTQAQCALLGVSAASYAAGGPASSPAQQYNGLIGGNPKIQPEVAKTSDIGFVFTPTFLPNFNATLDYTDIRITNLINTYGPNTIQANCVSTGSPVWCNLVHRDAGGTLWASLNAYTSDTILNEGGLEYKGADIGLAYKLDLGAAGRIRTRLDGTYLLNLIYRPGLGTALEGKSYDCAGQFGPDCAPVTPKWRHRMTIDYDTPITGLSAGITWRFFGRAANESLNSNYPGYQPGVADSARASGIPVADNHIPTVEYLDLRVAYQWNNVTARLGVNNVADKDPPVIDTGNSGGNSIYAESNTYPSVYDTLGRYLFVNVTVDF